VLNCPYKNKLEESMEKYDAPLETFSDATVNAAAAAARCSTAPTRTSLKRTRRRAM
jgi:hypothetical protein